MGQHHGDRAQGRGAWQRLNAAIDTWLCGPLPETAADYHAVQFGRQLPLLRTLVVIAFLSFVAFWWWDGLVQGAHGPDAQRLRLWLALPLAAISTGVFIGTARLQLAAYRAFVTMLMVGVCAVTFRSEAGLSWALPTYMAVPLVTAPFFSRWGDIALLVSVMVLVPAAGLAYGDPDDTIVFNYVFYLVVGGIGAVMLFLVAERTRRRAHALDLRIKSLAHHDALSGLLSRRRFIELADQRLHDAPDGVHALAFLDLDHFKAINDDYGHDAGDRALEAVGETLRRVGGEDSLAGRFGGEEFVLLLPRAPDAAAAICDALLAAVRGIDVHDRALSTSIGLAHRRHGEALPSLLRRADQALLQAKRDGRDRCHVAA